MRFVAIYGVWPTRARIKQINDIFNKLNVPEINEKVLHTCTRKSHIYESHRRGRRSRCVEVNRQAFRSIP